MCLVKKFIFPLLLIAAIILSGCDAIGTLKFNGQINYQNTISTVTPDSGSANVTVPTQTPQIIVSGPTPTWTPYVIVVTNTPVIQPTNTQVSISSTNTPVPPSPTPIPATATTAPVNVQVDQGAYCPANGQVGRAWMSLKNPFPNPDTWRGEMDANGIKVGGNNPQYEVTQGYQWSHLGWEVPAGFSGMITGWMELVYGGQVITHKTFSFNLNCK